MPVIDAAETSIAELLGIAAYQPAGLERLEEHLGSYQKPSTASSSTTASGR